MIGAILSRRSALVWGLALPIGTALPAPSQASESLTYVQAEDGRKVRISSWPAVGPKRGTILFSHGNESCPEKYLHVIVPWTAAGFDVLAPLHTDSTDNDLHGKYGLIDGWRTRLLDMRALSATIDAPYIAAGHSYGGLVALTLGGALPHVPPGLTSPLRDRHASCVLALSPPGISPGLIEVGGYAPLAVPALIQTGSQDILPRVVKDTRWHLAAYDEAPTGDKYALTLEGVDHWFGGLICEAKPGPSQDAQLATLNALSIDFLKAYGAHDSSALQALTAALSDTGPTQLLRK